MVATDLPRPALELRQLAAWGKPEWDGFKKHLIRGDFTELGDNVEPRKTPLRLQGSEQKAEIKGEARLPATPHHSGDSSKSNESVKTRTT